MAGSETFRTIEVLGEFVLNGDHSAPRTDEGYDGEVFVYNEPGQDIMQIYSRKQDRWTKFGAEQFQDTQLSSSQITNLAGTNIEVVSAPPTGTAVWPTRVHLFHDHGGTDYVQTSAGDNLALRYSGSNQIMEIGSNTQQTGFIEASADTNLTIIDATPDIVIAEAATAIDLDNNGGAEYSTGDGTWSVRVYYIIVPMAAFS